MSAARLSPPVRTVAGLAVKCVLAWWPHVLGLSGASGIVTAVVAGALGVGDAVQRGLLDLAQDRLGRIDTVVVAEAPFRASLADELSKCLGPSMPTEAGGPPKRSDTAPGDTVRLKEPSASRSVEHGDQGHGELGSQTVRPAIVLDIAVESPVASARSRTVGRATLLACEDSSSLWHADTATHLREQDATAFDADGRRRPVASDGAPRGGSDSASGRFTLPALAEDEVAINAPLAETLAVTVGDPLILRLPVRSAVPADSPLGRRVAESMSRRVTVRHVLPRGGLGGFSLRPTQVTNGLVVASLTAAQAILREGDVANALLCLTSSATRSETDLAQRVRGCLRPTLADFGLDLEPVAAVEEKAAGTLRLTSRHLLLDSEVDRAAAAVLAPLGGRPSLVFLATTIRPSCRDGAVPYSTVVGIDSATHPSGSLIDVEGKALPLPGPGEIVIDRWMADDFTAQGSPVTVGDTVEVTVFLPETLHGRVVEATHELRVSGVAAMRGAAVARDFVPDVEGVTDEASIADWDPPFPFDASRIRGTPPDDRDERYWKAYGPAPKAFVSLSTARSMAAGRFGATTAWHVPREAVADRASLQKALASELRPEQAGFRIIPVASQALEAARGSTPFGALFLGLSLAVVVAGLLLEWLLFRFLVASHRREAGVLAALGWPVGRLAELLVLVGGIAVAMGTFAGLLVAPLWSRLLIGWLASSWEEAVASGSRQVFTAAVPRVAAMWPGALAAAWVSLAALWVSARRAAGSPPLPLLREESPTRWWGSPWPHGPVRSLVQLARRGLLHHRSRTVTVVTIVAIAECLVVVVSAFALRVPDRPEDHGSPTGGWTHLASFAEPNSIDPADPETAAALGLSDEEQALLSSCTVERIRINGGDEASCANLYATARPMVYGVGPAFIDRGGFRFLSNATLGVGEKNPWTLLDREAASGGVIPAILDEATARWGLKIGGVGTRFTMPSHGVEPAHELEVVGLLEPGILQGAVIVSERSFLRMEPTRSGYSMALVDASAVDPSKRTSVARALGSAWADVGVAVQASVDRLRSLYAVQNTFLSGFQVLGSLGLLLGTFGVAAVQMQGVSERIGALAILRSVGFTLGRVRLLIVLETVLMVGAGISGGAVAGCLALVPLAFFAGVSVPWMVLAFFGLLTLATAVAAGLLAASSGTIPVRPRGE